MPREQQWRGTSLVRRTWSVRTRHGAKEKDMTEKEVIEREIELLLSLKYVTAYTGELSDIKQGSYVPVSEITKEIGKRRKALNEMKNKMKKRKP